MYDAVAPVPLDEDFFECEEEGLAEEDALDADADDEESAAKARGESARREMRVVSVSCMIASSLC